MGPVGALRVGPVGALRVGPVGALRIGPVGALRFGPVAASRPVPRSATRGPESSRSLGPAPSKPAAGSRPVRPAARLLVEPADLAELEDLAAPEDDGCELLPWPPPGRAAPARLGPAAARTRELPGRTLK